MAKPHRPPPAPPPAKSPTPSPLPGGAAEPKKAPDPSEHVARFFPDAGSPAARELYRLLCAEGERCAALERELAALRDNPPIPDAPSPEQARRQGIPAEAPGIFDAIAASIPQLAAVFANRDALRAPHDPGAAAVVEPSQDDFARALRDAEISLLRAAKMSACAYIDVAADAELAGARKGAALSLREEVAACLGRVRATIEQARREGYVPTFVAH